MTAEPESRFIQPSDLCPFPERWTSEDGDSTEVEVSVLVGSLVVALQPDLVVETGAGWGQSTEAIARALAANGLGRYVALEIDEERAESARRRAAAYGTGEVLLASSHDWEPESGSPPIGLLYSDSYYEDRVPELLRLRAWMRRGSVAVFHDTAPGRGSHRIRSGRDLRGEIEHELVRRGIVRVAHLPTPRGVSVCEVLR